MKHLYLTLLCGTLALCGCQQSPQPPTPQSITTPEGVTITPYTVDEIKRQKL